MERLGGLVNQLSHRLSQHDGKISSLEKSNHYIMSYLGKVDDRIDSLKSDWEETRDTIGRLQTEIRTLKRGCDKSSDYGDERVAKAGNKITAPKRSKRARLA
jgi:peptidoglycan hydrolase CwlO-like protein